MSFHIYFAKKIDVFENARIKNYTVYPQGGSPPAPCWIRPCLAVGQNRWFNNRKKIILDTF